MLATEPTHYIDLVVSSLGVTDTIACTHVATTQGWIAILRWPGWLVKIPRLEEKPSIKLGVSEPWPRARMTGPTYWRDVVHRRLDVEPWPPAGTGTRAQTLPCHEDHSRLTRSSTAPWSTCSTIQRTPLSARHSETILRLFRQSITNMQYPTINYQFLWSNAIFASVNWTADGAGNTNEENSSIYSIIRMH